MWAKVSVIQTDRTKGKEDDCEIHKTEATEAIAQ